MSAKGAESLKSGAMVLNLPPAIFQNSFILHYMTPEMHKFKVGDLAFYDVTESLCIILELGLVYKKNIRVYKVYFLSNGTVTDVWNYHLKFMA